MAWNRPAIQFVEPAASAADAAAMVDTLRLQFGCLGARVIGDGRVKPWAAQALFESDEPVTSDGWLPDGARRVLVSDAFLQGLR